jgi:hypothetical protein
MAAVAAQANPAILSFTGGSTFDSYYGSNQATPDVVGFRFSVNQELTVNRLGVYSPGADLGASHQVGIWRLSDSALLSSATVAPGSTQIGSFRYASVTGVMLQTGVDYVIGATYWGGGPDLYVSFPSSLFTHPLVNHQGAVYPGSPNLGFVMPTAFEPNNLGRFGPNFTFERENVIPGPAAAACFLIAGLARRRKK